MSVKSMSLTHERCGETQTKALAITAIVLNDASVGAH